MAAKGRKTCRKSSTNHPHLVLKYVRKRVEALIRTANCLSWIITIVELLVAVEYRLIHGVIYMIFNGNVIASNQMLLAERADHCPTVQRRENLKESYVRNSCKAIKTCNRVNMKFLYHLTTVFQTENPPLKIGATLLYTCFGLLLGSPPRSQPQTQQGFGIEVGSYHWAEATIVADGTEPKGLIIIPKYVVTRSEPNQGSCL